MSQTIGSKLHPFPERFASLTVDFGSGFIGNKSSACLVAANSPGVIYGPEEILTCSWTFVEELLEMGTKKKDT